MCWPRSAVRSPRSHGWIRRSEGVAAGSFQPTRIPASGSATSRISAPAVARIGPGQRATAAPTRRQRRAVLDGLGSSNPRRTARLISAGVSVSAATIVTRIPMAQGIPALRNDPYLGKTKACQRHRHRQRRSDHDGRDGAVGIAAAPAPARRLGVGPPGSGRPGRSRSRYPRPASSPP